MIIFLLILGFSSTVLCQSVDKDEISEEQGSSKTQFELGLGYQYGAGRSNDKKKAFYWYKKSAEQGYEVAQYNLGLQYIYGDGVAKNYKQSAIWIRKSYENGFEEAKNIWEEFELWKY